VPGLQAAQGISSFGEPGRVVASHGHVHGRVFRRERDCADAADREDAEFEFLYGGASNETSESTSCPEVLGAYLSMDDKVLKMLGDQLFVPSQARHVHLRLVEARSAG